MINTLLTFLIISSMAQIVVATIRREPYYAVKGIVFLIIGIELCVNIPF